MKLALVIVAAGSGTRMKLGINKIFNTLNCNADEWVCCDGSTHFLKRGDLSQQDGNLSRNGDLRSNHAKTVIEITLSNFLQIQKRAGNLFSQIIITYRAEDYCEMKTLIDGFAQENRSHLQHTRIDLVEGGQTRFLSVHNALLQLDPSITHVSVHDGARPFVRYDLFERLIEGLKEYRVCIPALKLTDTIRETNEGLLGRTLKREKLSAVQTPQCYDRQIARGMTDFIENLKKNEKEDWILHLSDITDDSSLIARVFPEVKQSMVEGSKFNIKITTPDDMEFARMFYQYLGGSDENRLGI